MRGSHISTRLILGGSQENTVLSCEGQARLGHEVHLAFGLIYGPEGSLLERVEKFRTPDGRRISTHVVPRLQRAINPVADGWTLRQLERLIHELRPDIVHTHSSKAGIIGRIAAWSIGRQLREQSDPNRPDKRPALGVVHTIHGPPFMPVEGGMLKSLRVRALNRAYTLAERRAAERCHVIVSVADAMTDQFLARAIGRREQYVTVHSGMETEPYLEAAPGEARGEVRARLGLSAGDFVVGTVARLAEHKGHDDLLDALSGDLRTHRHWRMLWVGDGWWRTRLIERARGMGLGVGELVFESAGEPDRAKFKVQSSKFKSVGGPSSRHPVTQSAPQILLTGLVPPERIPGLIRTMDVLAHPSYREGLPRTVPQALLAGVCPVAYDVDGTGEVCRNMETGRLVRLGDRAGLREAIRWLFEHPAERAAMAARGREECRERFSAERMVAELEKVYARAIELARGGGV